MHHPEEVAATREEDTRAIHAVLEAMNAAWGHGDGEAYAAPCTEDVDYVLFDGTRLRGRAENATAHQALFDGVLRGTRLHGEVESVAFLPGDVALVHGTGGVLWPWEEVPARKALSRQTFVLVRREGRWWVRAFHNTRLRPMPAPKPGSLGLALLQGMVRLRSALMRTGATKGAPRRGPHA